MKILLANPAVRVDIDDKYERYFIKAGSRWPWSFIKNKKIRNTNCFFPFFLAYTAAVLRNSGFEVRVIDGVALDMQEDNFLAEVRNINPEVVVIETTTHAINHDLVLCDKLKILLPTSKLALVGSHATVFAQELLKINRNIDFVIKGEYEFIVLKVAERIRNHSQDFSIDGLCYRDSDAIHISSKKGFIDDINFLPFPAYDLFPMNDRPDLSIYRDGICTYRPAITMQSSRGCSFRCDFCMWNQVMYNNGPYRMFKPKRVVDEMEYVIKNFAAKEIYFDDDDFCLNKEHVLDICKEIKKRNLRIKWSCMGDAIICDEEMIKAMAGAGCIFIKFGVESGNEDILSKIGKPFIPGRAINIAKWGRKYGIMTHATFCLGLDGETKETMFETLRLANEIKFDTAQVSIATPFPGTRYYQKLLEAGCIMDGGWDAYDGTMSCVFNLKGLTSKDIQSFRKEAIRSMVLHKALDLIWVVRFLKRSRLLYKNCGAKAVLEPFNTLLHL